MADVMGSAGLAFHQWRKHGRCSGLPPRDYFALSRAAYASVTRPEIFRRLERDVRLPARVVEEAWLEANPTLAPDMLTVTCRDGHVQEVRICLTRALEPRRCGADVRRDCAGEALLPAIE
jgi:ribonuclease T2